MLGGTAGMDLSALSSVLQGSSNGGGQDRGALQGAGHRHPALLGCPCWCSKMCRERLGGEHQQWPPKLSSPATCKDERCMCAHVR